MNNKLVFACIFILICAIGMTAVTTKIVVIQSIPQVNAANCIAFTKDEASLQVQTFGDYLSKKANKLKNKIFNKKE